MSLAQLPLQVCYQDFILDCQSRKLRPHTLEFYEVQLSPFLRFCADQDVAYVGHVTGTIIRRYLVSLQDRGLLDTSIHAAARAIRRFFRFCAEEEYIERAPKFNMPKLEKRILPALTAAEAQQLLKACRTGRDRALLLVALDTGLRAQELSSLDVGDVDLRTGAIHVHGGKGAKDRIVHIGVKARRAVSRHLASRGQVSPGEPLWLSATGKRLSRWGVRELCDRLSQITGIDASPHKLRRTAALLALKAGLPLPMIQAMLGHEHLSTTEKYLALDDEDRRQAHERFGAVDNLLE